MEETLLFVENCLKKYGYPSIYGAEIAEIFAAGNRTFLLSWFSRLVMQDNLIRILSVQELSEFLNSFGFCKFSQIMQFIESNLKYSLQLKIFYRICKFLDTLKRKTNYTEQSEQLSLEDLDNLREKDINIFKCFGPIKFFGSVTQVPPDLIMNLTSFENLKISNTSKGFYHLRTIEGLIQMMENVQISIDVSCMLKNNSNDFCIENDVLVIFNEFNENMGNIKKYIENVEGLLKFSYEFHTCSLEILTVESMECLAMVKDVTTLFHKINNM